MKKEHYRIIYQFNKVAQILLQFEILYFDAWSTDVGAIKTGWRGDEEFFL